MNQKYKTLFSPLTIRGITLKNRVEASPISLFDLELTPEHALSDDDIGFYRLRAAGGAAIVIIGDGIVHPTGVDTGYLPSPKVMACFDDSIPFLRKVSGEIQRHGAVACLQLNHAGMLSTSYEYNGWGPDQVEFRSGEVQYMTEDMIEEIVDAFGTSALRAKNCGFDMVMIHAGHGWLIHQFLSPITNHRTDRFGGSMENRCRFLAMILDRIRHYCGEDFLIEVRMSGTEYVDEEGGYTLEDGVEIAKLIDEKADIIHVSAGTFSHHYETDTLMFPSIFVKNGHNVYLAAEIRKHVKHAVISTVGGISDPAMMEDILASGQADLVAIGRALIADPQLPDKARRGQEEDIRPCIRCTFCLGDSSMRTMRCSVNPAIHRPWEILLPQKPAAAKKVLIAGGGPAGMEAALIASQRGHEVILCEKTEKLGGLIRYARKVPFKFEMEKYLDYMIRKVNHADIDIRLNTEVTAQLVKEISPDVCIAAVGSRHLIPNIENVHQAVPIMDFYDGKAEVKGNVVIIGGGIAGSEAAIELSMKGHHVTILEMGDDVARDANSLQKMAIDRELEFRAADIDIKLQTRCTSIQGNLVLCVNKEGEACSVAADTVILAAGMLPQTETVEALRNACGEFHWIGDCRKPRQLRHAVLEGYNAAMDL